MLLADPTATKAWVMPYLPKESIAGLRPFTPVFNERTWDWAQVLLVDAIPVPGQRTAKAILSMLELSRDAQFQNYHRVLNHATWSNCALAQESPGARDSPWVKLLPIMVLRGPIDAHGVEPG